MLALGDDVTFGDSGAPVRFVLCVPSSPWGATRAYLEALLGGDRQTASRLLLDAVESGTPLKDIYQVFQRSQYEIGRLWQMNKITVAQEHYCSAATQLIMSLLYPRVFNTERIGRTLVAACVQGDLHEIGMRIVANFFELEGWGTSYLGANMPTSGIVDALVQRRPDALAFVGNHGVSCPRGGTGDRSRPRQHRLS